MEEAYLTRVGKGFQNDGAAYAKQRLPNPSKWHLGTVKRSWQGLCKALFRVKISTGRGRRGFIMDGFMSEQQQICIQFFAQLAARAGLSGLA